MTQLNLRNNFKNALHRTAGVLLATGDIISDVKMPTKESIGVGINGLRRNLAKTIEPKHD